ncbi:MAG: hypothetical protein QF652_07705, partial [Dehalococcoidia bacterium]|nr:hypothetical protein [Dehalococcoidia bacterium]
LYENAGRRSVQFPLAATWFARNDLLVGHRLTLPERTPDAFRSADPSTPFKPLPSPSTIG